MSLMAVFAFVAAAIFLCQVGSRRKNLPPGPPTLPVIGNLHMLPTKFAHHKFTEWARTYGGIYSLKIGAGTAIVLTDPNIVQELLEKRNAITADRPAMHVGDVITGGLNFVIARYGDKWRTMRKTAHTILMPQAAARHLPIQRAEAVQLLHDILCTPESFYTHVARYSHSVIMSIVYGERTPQSNSPEIVAYFSMLHEWAAITEPGATPPVDMIPLLKLIPEYFTKWKRTARKIRASQRALYCKLLDATEARLQRGEPNQSYMEEVLEKQNTFGLHREMTVYLAGTLLEAGSETTSNYLNSLILCLVACPEVQHKAQDEIDRVVGEDRLPTLDDFENLPYIRAIVSETHRFRPGLPILVPHASTAPQTYGEYFIPSGSTIFVNLWGIFHDPALYEDPETFIPERYLLKEDGTKPGLEANGPSPALSFGVGRRSCPGIHLAQKSININVMNLIWAFNFEPAMDADGNPIQADTSAFSAGLSTSPLPFRCTITPRSAEKTEIIRLEYLDAADTFEKFESGLSAEDKEFVARSRGR